MNQDESVALWRRGKEVWNAWAEDMLRQKAELEKLGTWNGDGADIEWSGETCEWNEVAQTDLSGLRFMTRALADTAEKEVGQPEVGLRPAPLCFELVGFLRGEHDLAMLERIQRRAAIHEAGHAIATCRYGYGFHAVHVTAEESVLLDRKRREVKSGGFCEAVENFNDIHLCAHISDMIAGFRPGLSASSAEDYRKSTRERAFRSMVVFYAGVDAEARYTKRSGIGIAFSYGQDDYELAGRIADFVAATDEDRRAFDLAAEAESRRFVRDPAMWDAIERLADLLQLRGSIQFDEPDVLAITESIERIEVFAP